MLGEFFIDTCIRLGCADLENTSLTNDLFESIDYILKWYKKETEKETFPNEFRDKLELAFYIGEYRCKNYSDYSFEKMIAGINSGKFKELIPILESKKEKIEEIELFELIKIVYQKKKMCQLISGTSELQNLFNQITSQNYNDDDEIIDKWEKQIDILYGNSEEIRKVESTTKMVTLDLRDGDYSAVMNDLRENHLGKNVIKTYYPSIDNLLPSGGFEKRRLYLIGGTSGVGKSVLLINILTNIIKNKQDDAEDTYIYLTGENLVGETLERIYCCMTGEYYGNVVKRILEDKTFSLEHEIRKLLIENKSNIQICYFEAHMTTLKDIDGIVGKLSANKNLKAVFLDYLDLLKSGYSTSVIDTRIDQGFVSMGTKVMGVKYNVPFITPTQLNRSGYDKELEPSLTQMGESMLKINNSDFVVFLQPPKDHKIIFPFNGVNKLCRKVKATVLKNRNGEIGDSFYMTTTEKIGNEKVFNYRMEEMPKIREVDGFNFIEGNVENTNEEDIQSNWNSF